MIACVLKDYGFLYWIAFGKWKHFEHSFKNIAQYFQRVY